MKASFGPAVPVLALLLASTPALAADPAPVTVEITNFTFSPAEVTVPEGTTVTWVNKDEMPHLVADQAGGFRSSVLDTTQSFSFTFMTPGDFDYFCTLHPFMKGKVVVTQGGG